MNRNPITLSTGSVILHTRMDNGATSADRADGQPMTEAEYQEYTTLRLIRAAKDRKNAARRAKHQAYLSAGMTRVRGAQGGIYYE